MHSGKRTHRGTRRSGGDAFLHACRLNGTMRRIGQSVALVAAAFTICAVAPVAAQQPECSCQHIEAMQQEYRNNMTLKRYFEGKAKYLEQIEVEARKEGLNWDRIMDRSGSASTLYTEQHFPADGSGKAPHTVVMKSPECRPNATELALLAAEYPCRALADAAVNHEAHHTNICENELGSDTYWNRLQGDFAREEVAAYEKQAKEIKDELRRVLDEAATVTYQADYEIAISAGGVANFTYSYTARSEDIGGASEGDPWSMNGKGTSTVKWLKAVIAGMSCKTSGAVETTYNAKLTTDGLTFSLDVEELVSSGALGLNCPGGGGGGGPVAAGGGEGIIAENLPVKNGETPLPGDFASEMRSILAGSATVTGAGNRYLSISCSGP